MSSHNSNGKSNDDDIVTNSGKALTIVSGAKKKCFNITIMIGVHYSCNDTSEFIKLLDNLYGRAVIIWDGATFSLGVGESKTIHTSMIGIRNSLNGHSSREVLKICQDGTFECLFKPYRGEIYTPVELRVSWAAKESDKEDNKKVDNKESLVIQIGNAAKEAFVIESGTTGSKETEMKHVKSHCHRLFVENGCVTEATFDHVWSTLF